MAVILLPRQQIVQPTSAIGINKNTAFGANCVLAHSAAAGYFNLVNGTSASALTITAGNISTPYGITTTGSGSQNDALDFPGAPISTTFPVTFLTIFRTFNGGNSVNYLMTSSDGAGAAVGHDSSHQWRINGVYMDSPSYYTDPQDDATYVTAACSYNPLTGTAIGAFKNMRTGTLSIHTGSFASPYSAGNGTFRILPGGGTTKAPFRVLNAISTTALTQNQLVQLAQNPWPTVFSQVPRKIYVNTAGGGGTGVGSASFSFTATGTGASTHAAAGAATVTFGATAVGTGTAAAVGAATVTFAATGVGASSTAGQGVGAADFTFAATAVGTSTAAAAGAASFVFSASAVGFGGGTVTGAGSASFTFNAYGYSLDFVYPAKVAVTDRHATKLALEDFSVTIAQLMDNHVTRVTLSDLGNV